jgi:hypothetical protein
VVLLCRSWCRELSRNCLYCRPGEPEQSENCYGQITLKRITLNRANFSIKTNFVSVTVGVPLGAAAIDLVDMIGHAIDFAHCVVHRMARAIGLDGSRRGGLLGLCRSRLRAIRGGLRSLRLSLRLLDLRGRGTTSGSAERDRNCEDGAARGEQAGATKPLKGFILRTVNR